VTGDKSGRWYDEKDVWRCALWLFAIGRNLWTRKNQVRVRDWSRAAGGNRPPCGFGDRESEQELSFRL